ncbi:Flp pilus assembly protein CpaB [Vibrio sp. D404a]|uniref:Flp pilus assembly protein CpaB n=1 Tax=unclassified Vibrio TaxID=2614977 RepID=UPI002557631A|nr:MULTISPECIES: Flp pilus assembly protein CpaB [unclassified Vibrio]MDK9738698.1 Flp pilus assembly protein CpaB [Vibrio sp. D404a]MDK9795490.1 Flp pilus assembly protein CpaB [Vibrio sp. D449a]
MSIKVIVPVALIAIGAGLFGISQQYLNQSSIEESSVAPKEQEKRVNVLVLNQSLERGQVLSPAQFSTKQIPERQLSISQDEITATIPNGAVARNTLSPGDWLQTSMYVTPDQQGYIDATISDQMVPYPIIVNRESIVGGVIDHGTTVDVIALSSQQQNLAIEDEVDGFQSVSVSPILLAVKVLKIENFNSENAGEEQLSGVVLVLELSRKQVATLSIAKNIAQIEIHKSIGPEFAEQLQANSGDVLPEYRAIVEYRGDNAKIR